MKTVTIYTDGACSGNPGPGGWGAILIYKDIRKEMSGGDKETTNNKMELTAAIEGLSALKSLAGYSFIPTQSILLTALQKIGREVGEPRAGKSPTASLLSTLIYGRRF